MSPLIKIAWLKNHDKEKFTQASKFLSIKTYIIQQLTGEYVLDYSLASATGLMDIHKKEWDPGSLDFAGITADQLPSLVSIFSSPGKLQPQSHVALGLGPETTHLM